MLRNSKAFLVGICVLVMTAGGVAAETVAAGAAEQPGVVLPAISVSVARKVVLRDIVRASGLFEPEERVFVQPQIEGQAIDAILSEVGDTVAAGQVMARLSDTSLSLSKSQLSASRASASAAIAQAGAQLVEAQSSADEAIRTRDRTTALRAQGTVSQAAADQAAALATSAQAKVVVAKEGLEAARAQYAFVEAQIANIELQLQRTSIKAPVAGKVVQRNALVGAIASASAQPMFEIVRDGIVELRADVAEQDILRLAPGQGATLRVVGLVGPLSGKVRLVEPSVDASTRLGRVRIALDEPETVRAGMFAKADVLVVQRETLAVPISAVGSSAESASVLRVVDGVVAKVPVVTGIRDNGMIEILGGISAGDLVVSRAGAFVRDGDRINPVADGAAGATVSN